LKQQSESQKRFEGKDEEKGNGRYRERKGISNQRHYSSSVSKLHLHTTTKQKATARQQTSKGMPMRGGIDVMKEGTGGKARKRGMMVNIIYILYGNSG